MDLPQPKETDYSVTPKHHHAQWHGGKQVAQVGGDRLKHVLKGSYNSTKHEQRDCMQPWSLKCQH